MPLLLPVLGVERLKRRLVPRPRTIGPAPIFSMTSKVGLPGASVRQSHGTAAVRRAQAFSVSAAALVFRRTNAVEMNLKQAFADLVQLTAHYCQAGSRDEQIIPDAKDRE